MLSNLLLWRTSQQEIATSPPLAAPRNDSGFGGWLRLFLQRFDMR